MSKNNDILYSAAESEEILEVKQKVNESLALVRYSLLKDHPFIGSIAMRLNLVPVRDVRCQTACTDYKNIYFNVGFYSELNNDERLFVLAHEIWHVVYMHMTRRQNRDPEIFNVAADCEINYMLKNEGFHPPSDLCFPDDCVKGCNAEQIYEYLLKKQKKQKKGKSGNGKDPDDGPGSSNGNGSNSGKQLSGQFDKHVYENDSNDEPSNGGDGGVDFGVKDKWGNVGLDRDFKPLIDSNVSDKIREMIVSAAQHCERTQGHLPAGIESFLKEIMKPEISWKEVLAQFVTRHIKAERRWGPFNRRHLHHKLYLPGKSGEGIDLAVVVDTSGSCTADLPKFFGELFGLVSQWEDSTVTVIQCDATVQNVTTYDQDNPFTFNSDDFEVKGFGGSDFRPAFKHIEESGEEYDCIVCFTDGFIDFPIDPVKAPTLIVLTSDGSEACCDWAQKIKFKNDR